MPRKPKEKTKPPTPVELEILRILWTDGASTVRHVQQEMGRELGYTTVLKYLQIMTDKGLVQRRQGEGRSHTYAASEPASRTKRRLVGDVMRRVFDGSASELMLHALSGRKTSPEELDEIRRLIDSYEEGDS